jgi:Rrf2 family transcriptional regulator, cysteine metabolism repressor
MALLSRKTDYALLILQYLNERPHGGCAREIADRFEISRAFVANILKELCHKGFVSSHRGVKGGYVLQRPAEEVPLVELIESMEDPFRFAECNQPDEDDGCHLMHICPVKGSIAEIHQRIREMLSQLTLADIFRTPRTVPESISVTVPEPVAVGHS